MGVCCSRVVIRVSSSCRCAMLSIHPELSASAQHLVRWVCAGSWELVWRREQLKSN